MFARLAEIFRSAVRYRDELAIVVLGLAWQGVAGASVQHHAPQREEVVVRVRTAATAPRVEMRHWEVVKVAPIAPLAPLAPHAAHAPHAPRAPEAPLPRVAPRARIARMAAVAPAPAPAPVVTVPPAEAERVRQAIVRAMAIEQALRSGHSAASVESMLEGISTIN